MPSPIKKKPTTGGSQTFSGLSSSGLLLMLLKARHGNSTLTDTLSRLSSAVLVSQSIRRNWKPSSAIRKTGNTAPSTLRNSAMIQRLAKLMEKGLCESLKLDALDVLQQLDLSRVAVMHRRLDSIDKGKRIPVAARDQALGQGLVAGGV